MAIYTKVHTGGRKSALHNFIHTRKVCPILYSFLRSVHVVHSQHEMDIS